MDAEAIKEIVDNLTPPVVPAPRGMDDPNVYCVRDGYKRVSGTRPGVRVMCRTLSGFLDSLVHYAGLVGPDEDKITVFVNESSVTAVADEFGVRNPVIVLPLVKAAEFMAVFGGGIVGVDQTTLYRLLMSTLRGCVPDEFLGIVRRLKFNSGQWGQSAVDNAGRTLDLDVEAKVSGVGDTPIPETVTLTIPIFDGMGDRDNTTCRVECSVWVDFESRKFTIEPLPGERDRAIDSATDMIATTIEELIADKKIENVTVLNGASFETTYTPV